VVFDGVLKVLLVQDPLEPREFDIHVVSQIHRKRLPAARNGNLLDSDRQPQFVSLNED
jgi:hypothetical protein